MKSLDLDVLAVDSFEVARPADAGLKPTDGCTSESVIRCSGACPSAACSDRYC
jgi:hypothetical protein